MSIYSWEVVPRWVKYIARQPGGRIIGYSMMPSPGTECWWPHEDDRGNYTRFEYLEHIDLKNTRFLSLPDWKDSLEACPEYRESSRTEPGKQDHKEVIDLQGKYVGRVEGD